jgi:uncharacterized membrane protein YcjF (UPF0283 family)
MCAATVQADAIECPECGEPFSAEAIADAPEKASKSTKMLFWGGLLLIIIGGPGVALGSWLHDFLKISIANYDNFESFGWANQLVSIVGMIILVIGIILLIVSLSKMEKEYSEDIEPSEKTDKKKRKQGG